MTDKQIKNQEEAIKMIKKLNEKLKNVDDYVVELRSNFYRMKQDLDRKEQECKQLREIMHKDLCTYYVLGECSQNHHDNCVGRNQCIKDLEQECEQLKAELELFKTSNQTTIDQLKAENEDLKKSILQECPNCGEEYLNYKGAALYFENSDLKQTLAEIKEIAESCQTPNTCKDYCRFFDVCVDGGLPLILQKINEVEDEQNNTI